MGEGEIEGDWHRDLMEFINRVSREIPIEAIILHGSWARGLGGIWSDVDVIVISDAFHGMKIHDRIGLLLKFKVGRIEPLGYTFEEFRRMAINVNPLALGALIEGKIIIGSERVMELSQWAREHFRRVGRVWYFIGDSNS